MFDIVQDTRAHSAQGMRTKSDSLPSKPSDNWLIVNLNNRNYEKTEALTFFSANLTKKSPMKITFDRLLVFQYLRF